MKLIHRFLFAVMLGVLLTSQPVVAGEVRQANSGREGQTVNPKSLIVPGSPVVIDLYSPYCPPCVQLAPRLEQLARKSRLVVMKVNINRPGFQGIDWQSPVARQFGLKSVPYLVLLDPQGKLVAEGEKAMDMVERMMQQAGIQ